jgi:hypothetical protein
MGVGGEKKPLHEIPETIAAGRDEDFEEIINRIKKSGGEISKDEITPLYTEVGMDEFEVGSVREIEFTLNKNEFKLERKVETHTLQGGGRQKHIEELDTPRIRINLKIKPPFAQDWQTVDLEDMF